LQFFPQKTIILPNNSSQKLFSGKNAYSAFEEEDLLVFLEAGFVALELLATVRALK